MCADTHIRTQVLECASFISCVTFLNFKSKYLEGTVSPDFLPIFSSFIHPIWGPNEQAKIFLIFELGNDSIFKTNLACSSGAQMALIEGERIEPTSLVTLSL